MGLYRSRHVVEAYYYTGQCSAFWPEWATKFINNNSGVLKNMWIVHGLDGQCHPLPTAAFNSMYEAVLDVEETKYVRTNKEEGIEDPQLIA